MNQKKVLKNLEALCKLTNKSLRDLEELCQLRPTELTVRCNANLLGLEDVVTIAEYFRISMDDLIHSDITTWLSLRTAYNQESELSEYEKRKLVRAVMRKIMRSKDFHLMNFVGSNAIHFESPNLFEICYMVTNRYLHNLTQVTYKPQLIHDIADYILYDVINRFGVTMFMVREKEYELLQRESLPITERANILKECCKDHRFIQARKDSTFIEDHMCYLSKDLVSKLHDRMKALNSEVLYDLVRED